jgi:hypothetical protein
MHEFLRVLMKKNITEIQDSEYQPQEIEFAIDRATENTETVSSAGHSLAYLRNSAQYTCT